MVLRMKVVVAVSAMVVVVFMTVSSGGVSECAVVILGVLGIAVTVM